MARLITTGFEISDSTTASLANFPEGIGAGTTPIRDLVTVRSGISSLKCAGTAANLSRVSWNSTHMTVPALGTGLWVRIYFNVSALPTNEVGILRLATATAQGYVASLDSSGIIRLRRESSTTPFLGAQIGADSSSTVSAGNWYRLELYGLIVTGVGDATELRLDGTTVASASAQNYTDETIASVQVGWGTAPGNTADMFLDDVAINDSTGAAQNTFPGSGKVFLQVPVSDNVVGTGWTLGTGTAIAGGTGSTAVKNTPPLGVADLAAGSDPKQIRNAASAANSNYDANLTTYTNAGIGASDTINVLDPIVATAAPVSTSAKAGTIGVSSNPAITNVALSATGVAGAFWQGNAAGTYPTGWKWSHGTVTYAPTVTLASSPVARITQVTASTRIAMVCFLGMYVDYTPVAATTYTKAGRGIAPFTGGGAKDQAIVNRSGIGISPRTGGGADVDMPAETGAGVAPFTGGGADAPLYAEAGKGIAPFTGGGTRAVTHTKAGAGVAPFTGSGSDFPSLGRSGAGVVPFTGSGADVDIFAETGASLAPFTGGGVSQRTVVKSGIGFAPFTGSGADVDLFAEAGTGIAPFTGGGTKAVTSGGSNAKSGIGVAPFTGGGADAPLYVETGTGVTPFTGSGADVALASETGSGVAPFSGIGSRAIVFTKSGIGVSAFAGTGDSTDAFVRLGSGVASFTGSGADIDIAAEAGTGVSPFAGSGADTDVFSETGTGVSMFAGSGAKAFVYTKTGAAVSDLNVSGIRALVFTEAGAGVSALNGSGSDSVAYTRTGIGVSPFTGAGSSTRSHETTKSGAAIAVFTGGGTQIRTKIETGSAVAPFTGSGADEIVSGESGSGVFVATGGGARQVTWGTSGYGVIEFTGGGAREIVFLRDGVGIIGFFGSGSLNAATAPLTDFTAIIISDDNSGDTTGSGARGAHVHTNNATETVNKGKNRVIVTKDDTEVVSNG